MNTMEYKGYVGIVELDTDRNVLRGQVINIRDVITYEGKTVAEVCKAFEESVEDYLEFCKERGESPEKPFSGKFQVRITPCLHREISTAAQVSGKSLNSWVSESLELALHSGRIVSSRPAAPKPGGAKLSAPKPTGKATPKKEDLQPA